MKSQLKKIINFLLIIMISSVSLIGCSQSGQWVYPTTRSQQQIRCQELAILSSLGAEVLIQGEKVKIVLPDDALFAIDSANLTDDSRVLLTHVVRLVKTYSVVKINVTAYSDSQAWPGAPYNQKLGLTNRQAEVVASYLWASGIDVRFISARGLSEAHPVAWNGTPLGRYFNRRVELTFQFFPRFVPYN